MQQAVLESSGAGLVADVGAATTRSAEALIRLQQPDGHWVFELEADATITAEYILLDHFLGKINQPLHERMATYLRGIQEEHGGWPLFYRGALDISASVKAYFALKCVGDDENAPHMVRAREAILKAGGAERSNVFTRIQMALFGAVPWLAVPIMPVEIILLPRWAPFHLSKVSYWSRTVIAPLLVIAAKKPLARNPKNIRIDELFVTPPAQIRKWAHPVTSSPWASAFGALDMVLRMLEPFMPKQLRQRAIEATVNWVSERLNGEHGLGAIYPAMANVVMMYASLGCTIDHPDFVVARRALDKLIVDKQGHSYCQPCFSPLWDTALTAHALMENGASRDVLERACDWLRDRQILNVRGDWAVARPDVRPGGWAFQYANPFYPDTDDTAVVIMALDRLDRTKYRTAIERGTEWVLGLQSKNGGWGAFDADNFFSYLNHIPFADHGALLDPPSADVSARCLSMLAQIGYRADHPRISAAIEYLRREQEPEGCWFGRWGTNYIYGTWSVLCALNAVGIGSNDPMVQRAAGWLKAKQQNDGGWGEDGASYWKENPKGECAAGTPAQTSWALLALMAIGEADSSAVQRGISWLLEKQKPDGTWDEPYFTAVGFPRVFYLRYHGYKGYFPQWALSRYRNLRAGNAAPALYGM